MNNVTLSGHVGQTPQITDFDSGSKVCRFSLAVKNNYRPTEPPMWINIEAWGALAERVVSIITAGREVIVQGDLAIEEYESKKDNKIHTKPVVKLTKFDVCGARPKTGEASSTNQRSKSATKKAAA